MKRKINPDNLVWKSEYNVKNYKIDVEHQSLFKLAKKAFMIRTMENDEQEIIELKAVLHSLSDYVKTHFKNEEIYMESINYPEIERHKKIHIELLKILDSFVRTLNDLTIDEIEETLYEFIENYFITHIVDEDMIIGIWAQPLKSIRHNEKWNKDYETGIDLIDDEHKKLFEILDEAFEEVEEGERDDKIKNVLTHLYDFMKKHFKKEEEFMKEINFSFLVEHTQIHQNIIHECNTLLQEVNQTNAELFEKKLAQLIDEHIINHILVEDKKLVSFYEEQKMDTRI